MKFLSAALALVALALVSCRPDEIAPNANATATRNSNSIACLNINTATIEELAGLPGIGEVIAERIIEYRGRNGAFRRPQEIIIIDGMSEKKYRLIADLVCV